GCHIETVRADVADKDQVQNLINRFSNDTRTQNWPKLKGIIHAAGTLDDGVVSAQDWTRFETVLRPKVAGAWHIHRATENHSLDWFVLYSSAAATLGGAGQTNYSAANAFLDGLAVLRRREGLPSTCMAWGPWDIGMAQASRERSVVSDSGLRPLASGSCHRALASLVTDRRGFAVVIDADWRQLAHMYAVSRPPLLSALLQEQGVTETTAFADRLRSAAPSERFNL
ncbi:MAG: KR domain-containing protein, partial [Hyphomicrobiales bacterium]|nr:KR domain-containing protein [Hyphomicrobiales bacterium]